ncbi:MAG: hypothetical protein AAF602_13690, partial [Myxococcota bacterium]
MENTQLTVRRDETYLAALWRAQAGAASWFVVRLLGGQGLLAAFLLLAAGWTGPGLLALAIGTAFEALFWTFRGQWMNAIRRQLGVGWAATVELTEEALVHTTLRERTVVPWTARVMLRGDVLTVRRPRRGPLVVPLGDLAPAVRSRLRPTRDGGRVRVAMPTVAPRVRLLLAHAAARGPAGPTH